MRPDTIYNSIQSARVGCEHFQRVPLSKDELCLAV